MGKTEFTIIIIIFNLFLLLFVTAIISYVWQYKAKKKAHLVLLDSQLIEHQKEILATQLEIQRQTMEDIGREIHDNIGQKLTLASLCTQQLGYENKAPQINDAVENISSILNNSLTELRALSKSLTDNRIHTDSISNLLEEECDKIKQLKNCNVTYNFSKKKISLSYQAKSILLRITQEFLNNSIKHSKCKNIFVLLGVSKNTLQLCLQDDGKGFDVEKNNNDGIGLTNIKKRAEMIGGSYQLESNITYGTKLTIELPI